MDACIMDPIYDIVLFPSRHCQAAGLAFWWCIPLIYGIVWLLARDALLPDGETRGIQTQNPQPYNLNPESWTRRQEVSRRRREQG